MIADQHRGLYAPGQVPQWLERHATKGDWGVHSPSGSLSGGWHQLEAVNIRPLGLQANPRAAVAAAAAQTRVEEHDHFILLASLGATWFVAISVVVMRWLRVCSSGRKVKRRRPGEPRTDFLHRF